MTSTQVRPPATPPGARTASVASLRDDVIGVLLGTALIGGVLTDAWAHTNRLTPDSGFFTPWHALLYSGFAGTAAWTWWLAFRHRHGNPLWWRNSWPAGYGIGAIATLLFAVGGAMDMLWHTLFGVELSLKAALSPSHLLIAGAGALLVTNQMRSWWASDEGGWRSVTGLVSASLGTIFGTIVLAALTALNTVAPTQVFVPVSGDFSYHTPAAQGIQSYLLASAFLLIPFLLVHRRRTTPGAATAVVAGIGLFLLIQREFPSPQTAAIVAMITGAAIVDVALWRLDARRGLTAALRLPIAGAAFAAAIWTGQLIGLQIAAGVRWPVELWSGIVVVTAALGALMGLLAAAPDRQEGLERQAGQ
jgi:hypothetical protein